MIETILLTVLFTIFGVSVVISLIWLTVTSWKAKKLSNENSEYIKNLNTNLSNEVSEMYKNYDEKLKEINTEMDRRFVEVFRNVDSRFVEVYRTYDMQIKEIYSKMDRRFDKLPNLYGGKVVQVHKDDVWTPIENPVSSEKAWNLTPEENK